MSSEAAAQQSQAVDVAPPTDLGAHAAHGEHEEHLWHQFENRSQQDECYIVGMWTFLVTEILFFGALFMAYTLFRILYPRVFIVSHEYLDANLGGLNTFLLLTSSLSMALGVWAAQTRKRWMEIVCICFTMLMGVGFLVVKLGFEWYPKWQENLVPGASFHFVPKNGMAGIDQGKAQLFFALYFVMTGLHGIHVLVGIGIMLVLVALLLRDHPLVRYYMPVELTGLYWHFVDIVWIFLFPLFYLIGKY